MDPIILVVVALLAGLGVGWFLGSRQAAVYRQERDALQTRVGQVEIAAAGAEERAKAGELLRMTLNEVTKARDDAQRPLAGLQADSRNFELRLKEIGRASGREKVWQDV